MNETNCLRNVEIGCTIAYPSRTMRYILLKRSKSIIVSKGNEFFDKDTNDKSLNYLEKYYVYRMLIIELNVHLATLHNVKNIRTWILFI